MFAPGSMAATSGPQKTSLLQVIDILLKEVEECSVLSPQGTVAGFLMDVKCSDAQVLYIKWHSNSS